MKRIISLILSLTLAFCMLGIMPASAAGEGTVLRIGLYYGSSSLDEARLENASGFKTGYSIGYFNGTSFVSLKTVSNTVLTMTAKNGNIQVADTNSGAVLYTTDGSKDHLAIRPNSTETWFKGYKWKGDFCYRINSGKVSVINYVGVEDYVKGVLPYEMSADWATEALKAQAVAARSFGVGTRKHSGQEFDLCNTTDCQVYLGTNRATSNSDAAVDQTKGEILYYNGNPVIGYFFSSSGGATEDAANVWGGDYGYLKGVKDTYEDTASSLNGVWKVTLTPAQIQTKLKNAGYSIGTVTNVEVTKRTAMDNVNQVTVTDSTGKKVVIEKAKTRTVFGLNSIRYTITPNTGKSVATAAVAASPKIEKSTHAVSVDGKAVKPQGYLIGGENYFKLRDIAYILKGTDAKFNVTWNGAQQKIALTSGQNYKTVGGEMASSETTIKSSSVSTATIELDGKKISLTGYNINQNNYYRVRDIASALDFGIGYDSPTRTVLIETDKSAETPSNSIPTSYVFNGTGWGHNVGMSQYGALGMAKQGKNYDEILKFYYTGITVAK